MVNPQRIGTKLAIWHKFEMEAGATKSVRVRLSKRKLLEEAASLCSPMEICPTAPSNAELAGMFRESKHGQGFATDNSRCLR